MKLTGPQKVVLGDARDGIVWRGKHNHICKELRRLGLVTFKAMLDPHSPNGREQPAWPLTDAGREALAKITG